MLQIGLAMFVRERLEMCLVGMAALGVSGGLPW